MQYRKQSVLDESTQLSSFRLGLKAGGHASALFNASSVILGVN